MERPPRPARAVAATARWNKRRPHGWFRQHQEGNYATAAQAFADAERLYKDQDAPANRVAEAIAYRAWCYTKLNRAIEAIPLYEQALDLETQHHAKPGRIAQLREQLDWAKAKCVGAS